jgi:hypothetical protein
MSNNTLTVVETVNAVTVTPIKNAVTVSPVGIPGSQGPQGATGSQGPQGATGATGAKGDKGDKGDTGATGAKGDKGDTGDQGSSGVVTVNEPITNAGTSTTANLSVSTGTTSAVGVLQLTDSVSSTSTTTAATPNSVKTAYDFAVINPNLEMVSGLYYRTLTNNAANLNLVHQRTYYTPIFISSPKTVDRIAMVSGNTFSGTSTVRLGIYNNTAGQPSTLLLDAGTVSPTTTTTVYQITISQPLAVGFYWLAFCQQGVAPTTANYSGANLSAPLQNYYNVGNSLPTGNGGVGFSQSSVTGEFENATSLSPTTLSGHVWLRSQ